MQGLGLAVWRLVIFLLVLFLLTSCTRQQPAGVQQPDQCSLDLHQGQILDSKGRRVQQAELASKLGQADFILLGESHANSCDHELQARVLSLLAESGKEYALGLEMLSTDKQDILHAFNQGQISLKDLEPALDWQEVWGHDFSLYKPVFAVALQAGFPLYGLNVPREALQALREKGLQEMPEDLRSQLPERIIQPSKQQKEQLDLDFQRHKQMLEPSAHQLEDKQRFFLVQSIWDSQMAEQALQIQRQTSLQVLVLAGSEHARRDQGIAYRLQILAGDLSIQTLVPWRGEAPLDPEQGDFFFYCPQLYQSRLGFVLRLEQQGMVVDEVQEEPLLFQVQRQDSSLSLELELGGN